MQGVHRSAEAAVVGSGGANLRSSVSDTFAAYASYWGLAELRPQAGCTWAEARRLGTLGASTGDTGGTGSKHWGHWEQALGTLGASTGGTGGTGDTGSKQRAMLRQQASRVKDSWKHQAEARRLGTLGASSGPCSGSRQAG